MSEPRPLILLRRRDHPQGDPTGKGPPAGTSPPPDTSGKVPGLRTPERSASESFVNDDAKIAPPEATFPEVSYPPRYRVELARRVANFRRQLAGWTGSGVPLLVLPDAPEPQAGRCLSCGEPAPEGWRCVLCLHAVHLALGVTPEEGT